MEKMHVETEQKSDLWRKGSLLDIELGELVEKWGRYFAQISPPFYPLPIGSYLVKWNSRMRTRAGLCLPMESRVELNPHLLNNRVTLEQVLVHELCHLVVARRFPYARAHGAKWKKAMSLCGFEPQRCHNLAVVRRRRQKRWPIQCSCQTHRLATVTYNRISRGVRYQCRVCQDILCTESPERTIGDLRRSESLFTKLINAIRR